MLGGCPLIERLIFSPGPFSVLSSNLKGMSLSGDFFAWSLFLLQLEEKGTKTSRLEDTVPEVRELLDHMEEDVLFRHKVLVYFYEYKKGQQSPGEGPSPPVPTGE